MVKKILKDTEDRMHKAVDVVRQELIKIRTGKATTALLEGIKVEYYGTVTIFHARHDDLRRLPHDEYQVSNVCWP